MGVKTESLLRLSLYLILLSKVLRTIIPFYKYTTLNLQITRLRSNSGQKTA